LLALCALAFVACTKDSPQGVVKEYLDLCKAEKFEKAVDCLHFKGEMKESELTALAGKMQKGYSESGGIDKYEIISEDIVKDEAGNAVSGTVVTKIYFKDGKVEEDGIPVIKTDGKWKIDLSVK